MPAVRQLFAHDPCLAKLTVKAVTSCKRRLEKLGALLHRRVSCLTKGDGYPIPKRIMSDVREISIELETMIEIAAYRWATQGGAGALNWGDADTLAEQAAIRRAKHHRPK